MNEYDLADVIIGRPYPFSVGRKHFCLYPVTLAKMYLLKRQIEELGIDNTQLAFNPFMESLRLVQANRDVCCHILAYHTAPNTYKDLFDYRAVKIRKNYFAKEIEDEDLAAIMLMVLTSDKTAVFMKELGLDKERERLQKVLDIKSKHDKNTLSFGGLSVFGTFIAQLKEIGYTDNEILYERGYTYLRLVLADKITSLHLTDEEMKEVPTNAGGHYLDANDPENAEKILSKMRARGVG